MVGRIGWALSFLVGAALFALVVSALLSGDDEETCAEWQERYRAAAKSMGVDPGRVSSGTLQFVNLGPFAELEESQPEGCPSPR